MTNQTIDGVPRRVCHACVTYPRDAYCPVCDPTAQGELRALLDAPAINTDVRTIMLDVTPDFDGMGHEVYARSCEDVVAALGEQGDRIEELEMELHTLKSAQPQGEPVPITGDMNRLMVAYKNGEFSLESGSETVEAMSVASFDTVESHGHDADSYMSGYCAAIYEQAKPFVWLALQPKAEQPAPVAAGLRKGNGNG